MKVIFFGSDDFALIHLEALKDAEYEIVAVVTQPDARKNRGQKLIMSPIKEWAQALDIDVLQPTDLNEIAFVDRCRKYDADFFIVIAYGRFLPQKIIDIPKICAINVHGSLLPKYRGAAPINWAIINGDKETGVSIIKLNVCMDAGRVLSHVPIIIKDQDTSITLRKTMMSEGPKLLCGTLACLSSEEGRSIGEKQNEDEATFAPKLTKELGCIDFSKSALTILNKVRGLLPWPSAYTAYEGKRLKILAAEVIDLERDNRACGSVVSIDKAGFVIATSQKGLLVKKVHLESSKPMDAHSFLIGHPLKVGFQF